MWWKKGYIQKSIPLKRDFVRVEVHKVPCSNVLYNASINDGINFDIPTALYPDLWVIGYLYGMMTRFDYPVTRPSPTGISNLAPDYIQISFLNTRAWLAYRTAFFPAISLYRALLSPRRAPIMRMILWKCFSDFNSISCDPLTGSIRRQ